MLDGALSIGDLKDVTWMPPAQVFEIKLRNEIRRILEPVTMKAVNRNLARIAREAKLEVERESYEDPKSTRNNVPLTPRPDWLQGNGSNQLARRTTPHRSE